MTNAHTHKKQLNIRRNRRQKKNGPRKTMKITRKIDHEVRKLSLKFFNFYNPCDGYFFPPPPN